VKDAVAERGWADRILVTFTDYCDFVRCVSRGLFVDGWSLVCTPVSALSISSNRVLRTDDAIFELLNKLQLL
jgi:hypothetical protein